MLLWGVTLPWPGDTQAVLCPQIKTALKEGKKKYFPEELTDTVANFTYSLTGTLCHYQEILGCPLMWKDEER